MGETWPGYEVVSLQKLIIGSLPLDFFLLSH